MILTFRIGYLAACGRLGAAATEDDDCQNNDRKNAGNDTNQDCIIHGYYLLLAETNLGNSIAILLQSLIRIDLTTHIQTIKQKWRMSPH